MSEELEIICTCYHITRKEIEKIAKEKQISSIYKIGQLTFAGTNCGRCQKKIQSVLKELYEQTPSPSPQ
jgi:bacterioferritin-associated ferredoxin